jgi:DNA-binding beta-propeller fold protein YncE
MLNRRQLLKLSGQGLIAMGAIKTGCVLPLLDPLNPLARIRGVGEDFLVFDSSGAAYRIDSAQHKVQKLTASGEVVWEIGELGSEHGQLNFPTHVEITPQGHLLVVDKGNHRIERFDADGNHLSTVGTNNGGADPNELDFPGEVELGPDGRIYVCDTRDHHVHVYDENGELIDTFGEFGTELEHLNHPTALELDGTGHLHVIDAGSSRIQVFNRNGDLVRTYGEFGDGEGGLRLPTALLIDARGVCYVADAADHALDVFGPDGDPLAIVDLVFDDLRPCSPTALSWAPNNEIYVAGSPVETAPPLTA